MAFKLLFSATLLYVLMVAALADDGVSNPFESCRPGWAIPHNPLPDCRTYVVQKCMEEYMQMVGVQERCCQQMSDITDYCRCEAVRIMANGVITERGIKEGGIEGLPGCDTWNMRQIASRLPKVCNLGTIHGSLGYCPTVVGNYL